jgi:cytochrome c553
MKTNNIIPAVLAAASLTMLLAACQKSNTSGSTGGKQPATAIQAQPAGQQNGQQAPTSPPVAPVASEPQGNPQAGQQLASAGGQNGITACVGCHGAQGEGNAQGGFPRLAGQGEAYLARQLTAYANGARVNPIMQPIAKAMNAQQMRDAAAYYGSLGDAPDGATGPSAGGAPAAGKGGGGNAERGRVLSEIGDNGMEVQACANCHGPGGLGRQPVYPYLAGQHAGYLSAAMGEWKNGNRKTDPSGQMPHVAQQLADADVAALSAYYSAQPAPPSAARLVNIPAGSSQHPAVMPGPGAPGPSGAGGGTVRGTGTEQGAPITGGSQGGGGGTQGNQPQNETPPPVKR